MKSIPTLNLNFPAKNGIIENLIFEQKIGFCRSVSCTSWWLQYSLYTYSPLMREESQRISLCDRSAALYFDIEKQIFDRLKNLRLMDQLLLVQMSKSFSKQNYNKILLYLGAKIQIVHFCKKFLDYIFSSELF